MPDGEPVRQHVVGEEERPLEAERLEHELLHGLLIGRVGEDLDQASGEVEACVVVRPHLAERRELRQRRHRCAEPRERIVAGAEVGEVVADPAGRVRQEMAQRDAYGDLRVAQLQLGEIRAQRLVEVQGAALDEPHRGGARERLRDRADLEQRVGRDVERVLERGDAEPGDVLLAVVQQPDGDSRRLRVVHRRAHRVADLVEHTHATDANQSEASGRGRRAPRSARLTDSS